MTNQKGRGVLHSKRTALLPRHTVLRHGIPYLSALPLPHYGKSGGYAIVNAPPFTTAHLPPALNYLPPSDMGKGTKKCSEGGIKILTE
ncbi:MAG: hypothetical protein ACRCY6_00260 [Bacteroidales bacterium]